MKILSAENPFTRFLVQYSLPILAIGIISRTFPITSPIYFIVPVLLIINILLAFILIPRSGKYLTYSLIIFGFPAYCLLTALWSLYPIISIQRSAYLLLLYAGILSSVLLYKKFFPYKGIGFLIPANIIILILSAISLIFGIPEDRWSGGNGLGFMGFAGHQNTLAAAILFTLPGLFVLVYSDQILRQAQDDRVNVSQNWLRISFWLLLTANCLLITLSYSRAALLSLGIGFILFLLLTKAKKILLYFISAAALILVLYFTIPFIQNSIDTILNKDGGKILGRRMILWEPSFEAAKQGGVIGLGYGVSAQNIKTPILTGSHYEDGRYVREKGNSTLALIEETGLIGLILFLLPMIWIIRKFIIYNSQFTIKENSRSNYKSYIVHCTLIAMLIHAQFEAWWVGVGSVSLPLYLIFLLTALLPNKLSQKAKETN